MKLRTVDLFAGVGGFALGLEETGGFETVAFVEIDPEAQRVLRKNWPHVPVWADVKDVSKETLPDDINVIVGGFPCQDISAARTGSGLPLGDALRADRSGLWFEYLRLIREIRPDLAIIENVSVLRSRGLDTVLAGLAEIGYDAEWHAVPAAAVGAPHRRDRLFILAYPGSARLSRPVVDGTAFPVSAPQKVAELGDLAIQVGAEWADHSAALRVGDGVPYRPHTLKQMGNAVSPPVVAAIGRAYLRARDAA